MKMKRCLGLVLMALLLCLPVWALAVDVTIGDGETVTLSGTLSEGYVITVDGKATLVLDHVRKETAA